LECEGYGVRDREPLARGAGKAKRVGRLTTALVAGSFASLAALVCVALAGACSSPAAPLQQGSQCLMTTDCVEGLVCVPPMGGAQGASKICSNNVSTTVSTEDAAMPMRGDGAAGDGSGGDGGAASDATTSTGDATLPGYDTGAPKDSGGGGATDATGGGTEAGD
jgi:hypothetical protein